MAISTTSNELFVHIPNELKFIYKISWVIIIIYSQGLLGLNDLMVIAAEMEQDVCSSINL